MKLPEINVRRQDNSTRWREQKKSENRGLTTGMTITMATMRYFQSPESNSERN
jgi:hypothetical protein